MPSYIFPVEFLVWGKNPFHQKHKEALLPAVRRMLNTTKDKQKGSWLCEVNTEFFDRAKGVAKYVDLITDAIYPALDAMFDEVPNLKKPTTSVVRDIWYNHYSAASQNGQEVHTHTECAYSGVYFLDLSEPNKTVFFSHLASISGTTPSHKTTDFIEEGDILIFPSTLMHYVMPAERSRTTIAFNIECQYEN
jgi:hypothetical protein